MDPFSTIRALNVAVLIVVGGALYVFWRTSGRNTSFLLQWSLYELAMAATVALAREGPISTIPVGIGVPVLLLGIMGYRNKRTPPRYAFALLFLIIVVPAGALMLGVGHAQGVRYLVTAISIAELAAAVLFFTEGGALSIFIAATFAARGANVLLYPLWQGPDTISLSFAIGQVFALAGGVGMLMAGFTKAYGQLQQRERELITAYKQSEELMLRLERRNTEYLEARQNAEAANATKTQFLANMSHELRTPLNAILGFSEMLMLMPADQRRDKAADYANNIHDAAGGLQAIISDILNLSRVEAGALEMRPETCDLGALFADIRCLMQPLADQKSISLIHRSEAPCLAHCDHRLTRQALINGVSNAIKYTERGGTVICSTAVEGDWAAATVEDNGVGIDESRLGKVFEPFWQEGNSFVAENTGVGLGLSIAKSYVEAQKGRIELKPAAQRGTVFRISLPRPAAQASGDARQSAAS